MYILSIETSCDETAISIVETKNKTIKVLSNIISSQIKLHAQWGGVVPNLAAREHLKNILPVLKKALKKAKKNLPEIDLISVTHGPGLIPALLIGTSTAKTLAYYWQKPLLGIHHIEGHIYANFLDTKNNEIKFPLLALVVSGGHTQLILMSDHFQYQIIGETQDDAVGEAFDKVARILNLGYPGGPIISQKAQEFSKRKELSQHSIEFPRPMLHSNNFNFSFSGLKTAVLYQVKKLEKENISISSLQPLLAYKFQEAAVDVLVQKTLKALRKYSVKSFLLAGGVSANKYLRKNLKEKISQEFPSIRIFFPSLQYTGDNASMIASAAFYRWKSLPTSKRKTLFQNWKKLKTEANLKL